MITSCLILVFVIIVLDDERCGAKLLLLFSREKISSMLAVKVSILDTNRSSTLSASDSSPDEPSKPSSQSCICVIENKEKLMTPARLFGSHFDIQHRWYEADSGQLCLHGTDEF